MDPDISLETPAWITVDSPPVHVFDLKQISWRIRATKAARGAVKITTRTQVIKETVDSRF
jgi:hypothetical protein